MRPFSLMLAVCIAVACLFPAGTSAQSSRYSTWSDPNASGAGDVSLDEFIEKLNTLIDEAEKAKAADPLFLQDLRALANGAQSPWNTVVLDDSFADGNFTANPKWDVLSGEYFIETGWGLRNRLISAQQSTQQSSGNSGDDLAKAILGAVLKRAAGTNGSTSTVKSNLIVTRTKISNAFALELEMSSWLAEGQFDVGVFQGNDANVGYRLLYVPGKGLQLHRVGKSGSSVVATSDALALEDKQFHTVRWTRGTDGVMRISVDDKDMITTSDKGFSDPFDGVRISDSGGDFIIKRITATGI